MKDLLINIKLGISLKIFANFETLKSLTKIFITEQLDYNNINQINRIIQNKLNSFGRHPIIITINKRHRYYINISKEIYHFNQV